MSQQSRTSLQNPEFSGRVGIARTDITPPPGIYARSWGSARHDIADGLHRPLLATCLVFQDQAGGNELILLTLDAMVFWKGEADKIRSVILEAFNLEPFQLLVHPSHSHGTPILLRIHTDRPGGDLVAPYLDSIPAICCDLIREARRTAFKATLGWAYGKCGLAYNRDSIDPETGRDICGINLEKPTDDTILVGRVTDEQGAVRSVIVNYACHPVSVGGGNRLISPDYVGAMREVVEKNTDGAICVFFHGPSGDTTPRRSYEDDVEAADQNGRELGFAALATLSSMFPAGQKLEYQGIEESGTPLGVWRLKDKTSVNTEIAGELIKTKMPIMEFPSRAELEESLKTATENFEIERIERSIARRDLIGEGTEGEYQFTVWRLGGLFLVATPAEPYVRFQVDLRARFPDAAVAVLGATDGALNYLPIPSAYNSDVYQVRVAFYKSGCLEAATNMAADVIQKMS